MGGWRAEGREKPGGLSSSLGRGRDSGGGCVSSVAPASQTGFFGVTPGLSLRNITPSLCRPPRPTLGLGAVASCCCQSASCFLYCVKEVLPESPWFKSPLSFPLSH